jgi:hypothetical protein
VLYLSPALAGNGIYNCRNIRGSAALSTHAEGRGMDLNAKGPTGGADPRSIPLGSSADLALRAWRRLFIDNHERLGVQQILYKTMGWRVGRGDFVNSKGVTTLHLNHMHTEQTREAARTLTVADVAAVVKEALPTVELTPEEKQLLLDGARAALTLEKRWDPSARSKLDEVWTDVEAFDHPELLAGKVAAIDETVARIEELVTPDVTS